MGSESGGAWSVDLGGRRDARKIKVNQVKDGVNARISKHDGFDGLFSVSSRKSANVNDACARKRGHRLNVRSQPGPGSQSGRGYDQLTRTIFLVTRVINDALPVS